MHIFSSPSPATYGEQAKHEAMLKSRQVCQLASSSAARCSAASSSKLRIVVRCASSSSSSSNGASKATAAAASASASSATSKSTASTSPEAKAKSARDWLVVGATGSVAVIGAYWYLKGRPHHRAIPAATSQASSSPAQSQQQRSFSLSSRTSFSIPVRDASNPNITAAKVVMSLLPNEVDKLLRAGEASTSIKRPAGACLVERYDTNSVSSNDPIEDRRAEVIVERDEAVQGHKSDLGFFAVMDGHAGWETSQLLSQKLIAFVALELDKVIREAGEYGEIAKTKARFPTKLWNTLFGGPDSTHSSDTLSNSGLDGDPEVVKRAIAKAFRGLDKEIVNRPVELLKEYELSRNAILASHKVDAADSASKGTRSLSSLAQSIFPRSPIGTGGETFTATQESAHETMLPALSGSCALLTYVDSARGDVYVACTGDSRAVAGWWDHDKQRWDVEPLSRDQTGRNPDEIKRMRAEHPASEADTVIMRGRVLGGLEPTRAFGDARYKWDRSLQERLYDAFLPGGKSSVRGAPRLLQTPPYVTAEPVVEWRRLARQRSAGKELKFVIMATDGLWDMISNQDAAGLVAAHLEGFRGTLDSSDLRTRCFESRRPPAMTASGTSELTANAVMAASANQTAPSNAHPLNKDKMSRFVFEDENLATHLTRNALGGANRERVASLLAIPAPYSRRYRDDITVNVILFRPWEQQAAEQANQQKADVTQKPMSKL